MKNLIRIRNWFLLIPNNHRGAPCSTIAFDDCCDDVVFGADLYHAVVDRCNRNATWAGYPASNDCLYLQDNGVHFSELGKRFTAIEVAAHLMPYL